MTKMNSQTCAWKLYEELDETTVWRTDCKHLQFFTDGGVSENEYKFCPYCGKEILVMEE